MQASFSVVPGTGPAAPSGMPRSRIVPALLGVVLAHAALITIFVTAHRDPEQRPVQSAAIVAQLLSAQSDPAPAAVQSAPQPPAKPVRTEPERPHMKAPPPVPRSPMPAASPAPAAAASPAPPSQSSANVQSAAPQTAAASASTSSTSPAAAPVAHETMAIAAPKNVPHADCRIVKPAYPELSRRREETGTAAVRFVIGTTGAIEAVTLAKSSGFPRLDDAAVAALRQSTCQPYVENGSPTRVSYTQLFTFGLDDD